MLEFNLASLHSIYVIVCVSMSTIVMKKNKQQQKHGIWINILEKYKLSGGMAGDKASKRDAINVVSCVRCKSNIWLHNGNGMIIVMKNTTIRDKYNVKQMRNEELKVKDPNSTEVRRVTLATAAVAVCKYPKKKWCCCPVATVSRTFFGYYIFFLCWIGCAYGKE